MDIPLKYIQLWSKCDARVFILLSLNIQIILIFLGRMRRTFNLRWIRMIVWCCYLLVDSVAIFVLGQLSTSMHDSSSSNAIIAFWAPFLILHLGDHDTITTYSVEDNELWARHLLWLIYHLSTAFYVIFCSLLNTRLLVPTLLIFFVAIIKYLEHSYSLYRASIKGFDNPLINFAVLPPNEELEVSSKAFWLYYHNKGAFIDALPDYFNYGIIRYLFTKSYGEILKVMSMVLSYTYDEFHTKAIISHSRAGYVLRVLCSICISLAFFLFFIALKDAFKHVDVAITYVLLSYICLDLVVAVMFLFSDWMIVSLLGIKMMPNNWKVLLGKQIVIFKREIHKRKYKLREIPLLNLFINFTGISKGDNKAPRLKIMNRVTEMLRLVQRMKVFRLPSHDSTGFVKLEAMQQVQAIDELIEIISSCLTSRCKNLSQQQLKESVGLFAFRQVTSIPQSDVQTVGLSHNHN